MVSLQDQQYVQFKNHWDNYPKGFQEKHPNFDAIQFVSYCDIGSEDKVLEVGIGGGDSCRLIAEKTKFCTFIDFNQKAVDFQKGRFPHLNILCADAINSPFESYSFDKILARYVIHNFPDNEFRTSFYREAAQLIRNNGELILGMIPNRVGMFFDLKNYIDPKMWHRLAREHFMFWPLSIKKLKEELCNFGFKFMHIRKTPEPPLESMYYQFRQLARRFFLPIFFDNHIIYNFVDIKFKKYDLIR